MKAIRWSDNDRYFGRFTYAHEPRRRQVVVMLGSGDGDDYPGCRLRLALGSHTLIIALPAIIKPFRRWVDTSRFSDSPKGGYWDQHEREYGFSASEGAVHWHYGEQTHEWPGSKSKVWFFPWREHNQVRKSLYDLAGEHFADLPIGKWSNNRYEVTKAIEDVCPAAKFEFEDFDGERIVATCRMEESEWKRGKGIFRLLYLGRNRVDRGLDLRFSSEVGQRKGSWKGGTVGHSVTMLPVELHEAAFKRYCEKEGLTFVGKLN
jgi:hypothetical protein